MKAILIMDMPKTCEFCRLCEPERGYCVGGGSIADEVDGNELWSGPDYDCPLVPARGYIDANGNLISWEDDSDVD